VSLYSKIETKKPMKPGYSYY